MVRCGIAIYGCDPMNDDPAAHGLEPALELRSLRRRGQAGAAGRERRLRPPLHRRPRRPGSRRCRSATATACGGRCRNNCDVLIGGRRYPLRRDASAWTTSPSTSVREPVVGVGDARDADRRATAPSARPPRSSRARIGTINYEILCGISRRVPRALPPRREPGSERRPPSSALRGASRGRGWLVGGAVRDRLLGRPTADYDVVLDGRRRRRRARALAGAPAGDRVRAVGRVRRLARARARPRLAGRPAAAGGRHDRGRPAPARPHDQRDRRAAGRRGELVDPFGGVARPAGAGGCGWSRPTRSRPTRCASLRLARLACELDFAVDAGDRRGARGERAGAGRRGAPSGSSPSFRRIVDRDRALAGLELMDALGATAVVLPELARLRGVEQSRYHHLDVYDHTLAVLAAAIELERDPGAAFGEHAPRRRRRCSPSRWPTS